MSEMEERIARAICRSRGENPDAETVLRFDRVVGYGPTKTRPDTCTSLAWKRCVPEAREIIEAMREPTEAMIEAGRVKGLDDGGVEGRWRAMIDAALKEPQPV